jgi:hypothetical protein
MPKRVTVYMFKHAGKLACWSTYQTLYDSFVAGLKDDATVKVTYNEEKSEKTLQQLGYYYAVIIPVVIEALLEKGNDSIAESQLFGYPVPLRPNKLYVDIMLKQIYGLSTAAFDVSKTTMTIDEMSDFLDFTIKWIAENLGRSVPPPTK